MANVLDFPVSFGFKATDGKYYYQISPSKPKTSLWVASFHHGEDRATGGRPVDVVVGGVLIGRTGETGTGSGVHLHTDKRPIGTSITNRNNFLNPIGWQNITGVVSFAGNNGSAGNMVAIHSQGYEYRFLHLSAINVSVGQQIAPQGGTVERKVDRSDVFNLIPVFTGYPATEVDYKNAEGKTFHDWLYKDLAVHPMLHRKQLERIAELEAIKPDVKGAALLKALREYLP